MTFCFVYSDLCVFRLQDLEDKHQIEIKMYKHRLKHLMSEQLNESTQKKYVSEVVVKEVEDENRFAEMKIKDDKRHIANSVKDIELSNDDYIRSLKREQDVKVTMLRHEFERRAAEVQSMYDARMKDTRDKLDEERREKIRHIQEKKEKLIKDYMAQHQKALSEIKVYYSDITHNNLDLIKSLKEEVKDFEAEQRKDEIRKNEKAAENRKLSAPLKRSEEEVIQLGMDLVEYTREKKTLRAVKLSLETVEKTKAGLEWEYEVLQQRFVDLKRERDDLRQRFMTSVFEVKQKSSFRGVLLEKKLAAIVMVQEEHEAQLHEVLARSNVAPTVLGQVGGRNADVLSRKTEEIRSLQSECKRLKALQDGLISAVQKKLGEFGLRSTEIGLQDTTMLSNGTN